MAKLTTNDLVNIENQTSTVTTINNNFTAVENALENTLSRDGTTPNAMGAALDMNSFRIINLPTPSNPTDVVRLQDLTLTYLTNTTLSPTPTAGDANKVLKINAGGTAYTFSGVKVDASDNLTPSVNNGSSLGTGAFAWSNMFLASGGSINFNNGNYTVTHSADLLTFNKSIALTTGNVTLSSGNLNLASGSLIVTNGQLSLNEVTAPAAPVANTTLIYAKDVGGTTLVFSKDSTGTERQLENLPVASSVEMESAVSSSVVATPSNLHNHPGVAKAWGVVTGVATPVLSSGYGVSSVSRPALGRLLVTLTTPMSSVNYVVTPSIQRNSTLLTVANVRHVAVRNASQTTTTFELECWDGTATTALAVDPQAWYFTIHGDQ